MSKILAAHLGVLIDLGTSIAATHDALKARLVAQGWRIVAESNTDASRFMDVLPPATEAVGNAQGRDGLRIVVAGTSVTFIPTVQSSVFRPKVVRFRASGTTTSVAANALGVKVGATTLTLPSSGAGATYDSNTEAIYNALVASADAEVSAYTYQLLKRSGSTSDDVILATAKGANPPVIAAATGTTATIESITTVANEYPANTVVPLTAHQLSIPIDLAAGFVYFMTIHERTLAFGTKTTAGTYGPIYATFADNAPAVAQTPSGCVPVELHLFSMETLSAANTNDLRFPHFWGITANNNDASAAFDGYDRAYPVLGRVEDLRQNAANVSYGYCGYRLAPLASDRISANQWQFMTGQTSGILGVTALPRPQSTDGSASVYIATVGPVSALPDVFYFIGTAQDEALQFTQDLDRAGALAAAVAIGDNAVTLADASGFPASGLLIVGSEVMEYTGKAGNQLTGVTRAKYGTTAQAHANGKAAFPGLWFMKLKGAAMLAGYTRPV